MTDTGGRIVRPDIAHARGGARPHVVAPLSPELAGIGAQPTAGQQFATLCRIEQTISTTMGEVRQELEEVSSAIRGNSASVLQVEKRLRESDERMEAILRGSTENLQRVGDLVERFERAVNRLVDAIEGNR